MKKLLLSLLIVTSALYASAQGTVTFQNATASAVYTNVSGVRGKVTANLSDFYIALYGGAAGVSDATALSQLGAIKVGFLGNGIFQGGTRTNDLVSGGTTGSFQVRIWNSMGGVYTSWSAAKSAWDAGASGMLLGQSAIIQNSTGNPFAVPAINPVALSLATFDVYNSVPEPSTIALGMLGLASVMFLRRRSK